MRLVSVTLSVGLLVASVPAGAEEVSAWTSTQALGPTDATSVAARQGLVLAAGRKATKADFPSGTVEVTSAPRTAGLFRSTDGGRTWSLGAERIEHPDEEIELRPIVEPPSLLAVPTTGPDAYAFFDAEVWRSEDDGETWARVGHAGISPAQAEFLSDGRLVIGLPGGGLRVSPDRGATWAPLGIGLPTGARVNQIEVTGGAVFVATEQGLYRSTDGGQTFTRSATGLNAPETAAWGVATVSIPAALVSPTVVFLARPAHSAAGTAIYRSGDLGETWTAMPPVASVPVPRINPGAFEIAVDSPDQFGGTSTAFYAGASSGLFVSTFEVGVTPVGNASVSASVPGLGWLRMQPLPGASSIRDIAVADRDPGPRRVDSVFATVFRASVYRADHHGAESGFTAPGWFDETDGGRTCLSMVVRPDGALFIACGRHVFRSHDAGATWQDTGVPRYEDQVGSSYFPLALSADGSLWTSGFADGLYHSDRAGSAWANVPFPGGSVGAIATHPTDPKVLFAAGLTTNGCCTTVLQRSTDGGLTWRPVLETGDNIYGIAVSPHDPRHVLVAAFDQGGWHSADGGETWSKLTELPSSPSSTGWVGFSPARSGLAYAVADGRVFRSTDFGISWAQTGTSPGSFPVASASDEETLFVTSPTDGVRVTRDGGATWQPINEGLPGRAAGALAFDPTVPGRVYVASGVLSRLTAGPPSYWTYRLDE